jgi:hypothetical protein
MIVRSGERYCKGMLGMHGKSHERPEKRGFLIDYLTETEK